MSGFMVRVRRAALERIPGTVPNVAKRKRQLERELRDAGMSKSQAVAEASRRFRGGS
jgi:hypothetical protein